jgi:adenosine deaminase
LLSSLLTIAILAGSAVTAFAEGSSTNGTAKEKTVAEYFEIAKENQQTLIAFLQQMPKGADLHIHLGAVVEIEKILKYAAQNNYDYNVISKSFVDSSDGNIGENYIKNSVLKEMYNPDSTIVSSKQREQIMSIIFDNLSMRNYEIMDENGHDLFFQYFNRVPDISPEEYYKEIFSRAVKQNISYLELMANINTADDYKQITALKNAILKENNLPESALTFNFIATVNRNQSVERFKTKLTQAIARFDNPDLHTVGITVLSAEDDIISRQNFDDQMKAIDDAVNARSDGQKPINFHLHGGELTLDYAEYSTLSDRISETIFTGHAKNVGHGVSVAWNDDVYRLLKYMRDNKIGVTICPTSNEAILNVDPKDSQFGLYWQADVPIAIATDDEGLSRTNLTNEFAKIISAFDLSYNEVKWLAFSSIDMSFAEGKSIFAADDTDFSLSVAEYNDLVKICNTLTVKEQLELNLYRRFYDFEKEMFEVIDEFGWND